MLLFLGTIKDFLVKKFLKGFVKKALDKLPFNGKKTILGILVVALGAVVEIYSQNIPVKEILLVILDAVKATGDYETLTAGQIAIVAGAVKTAIGLIHKALKAIK